MVVVEKKTCSCHFKSDIYFSELVYFGQSSETGMPIRRNCFFSLNAPGLFKWKSIFSTTLCMGFVWTVKFWIWGRNISLSLRLFVHNFLSIRMNVPLKSHFIMYWIIKWDFVFACKLKNLFFCLFQVRLKLSYGMMTIVFWHQYLKIINFFRNGYHTQIMFGLSKITRSLN